jgi:hypothetical protein
MTNFLELYGELGAVGVIVILFVMLLKNLMSSQTAQNEDLDDIRVHISKIVTKISNQESILLKLLDRWNSSDTVRDNRHEKLVSEINDLGDVIMEIKGSVSRINGKQ